MKKRLAAKKEEIMRKLKNRAPGKADGVCGIVLCCAVLGAAPIAGCALERSDPAARSNRATITLTVTASGDNSTASGYITDGLMATADGEGAITQPSTQTTEQSPDLTVPGDALSAGITAAAHLGGKAIDAYTAKSAGGNASADGRSALGQSCPDGNCSDSPCADGNCEN